MRLPRGGYSEEAVAGVPYVTQQGFWAGHRASGPGFGRILTGRASQSALRPAGGAAFTLSRLESGRNRVRKTDF